MEGTRLDTQLCRQCRGRCCQGHPGVWSEPQRFFDIFTGQQIPEPIQINKLLLENDLELRNLGDILIPAPKGTEHGCSAQSADGCRYPTDVRPCQCLALIPELETLLDDQIHCKMPPEFGSGSARENWRPFQPLLKKARGLSEKK